MEEEEDRYKDAGGTCTMVWLNIYIYFHGVTWIIMQDGRGSAVEELLVVSLGQHDCC